MIIRKLFSFEGAHIVRHCTTQRCARSIHGHSYKVEILLEADTLDNGQMVYDFGLMKADMRDIVDAFDHTLVFWRDDDPDYIAACVKHSLRWIGLPVSPSAEQLSRVFFVLIELALKQAELRNGEGAISLHSIIVHETATGYAQCFARDAHNPQMGIITRDSIQFSDQVLLETQSGFFKQ
jgi:6-pyruvoyltetrahydropterin/6-carboxytetrahydropterin synthase